jgi:hypothetical protein
MSMIILPWTSHLLIDENDNKVQYRIFTGTTKTMADRSCRFVFLVVEVLHTFPLIFVYIWKLTGWKFAKW